jgi:hypothetical protein
MVSMREPDRDIKVEIGKNWDKLWDMEAPIRLRWVDGHGACLS